MTRVRCAWLATMVAIAMLSTNPAFGQTPPPAPAQQTPDPARGQRAGTARAGRAALPPITANMNQQQLQVWLDTWAVMQADTELKLTAEQYPNFVARLRRVQEIKRRNLAERRRLMVELRGLVDPSVAAQNEAIDARVRALDEMSQATAVELRKAYLDLDAVLTPWQRGKFRLFEDQVERKKVELLSKIRPGGGAATGPVPGAGR